MRCAPCEGWDAKICGVMPVDFSYSNARVAAISEALPDSQSVTVEPPKPAAGLVARGEIRLSHGQPEPAVRQIVQVGRGGALVPLNA